LVDEALKKWEADGKENYCKPEDEEEEKRSLSVNSDREVRFYVDFFDICRN